MNQLTRWQTRRVFAAIDLEPTIVDSDDAVPLEGGIKTVEFNDVYFTYPNTTIKVPTAFPSRSTRVNSSASWGTQEPEKPRY